MHKGDIMEEIIESIKNGQRKEALEQIKVSSYLLEDIFEELLSLDMANEIIKLYRVAINCEYITFK